MVSDTKYFTIVWSKLSKFLVKQIFKNIWKPNQSIEKWGTYLYHQYWLHSTQQGSRYSITVDCCCNDRCMKYIDMFCYSDTFEQHVMHKNRIFYRFGFCALDGISVRPTVQWKGSRSGDQSKNQTRPRKTSAHSFRYASLLIIAHEVVSIKTDASECLGLVGLTTFNSIKVIECL